MNPLSERYPDLIQDQDDQALLGCIADLDATCAHFALPAERDDSLAHRLAAQAADTNRRRPAGRPTWLRAPWQVARWRFASVMLALLLAIGGMGAYLHGQTPTPVNAQTVLQRAAAVSPGPNEAAHSTYRLEAGNGYTGTGDVWVGADASGMPTQFALTVSMFKDGKPAPELSSRRVQTEQSLQVYDPAQNTVTIATQGASDQELEGMFAGVEVAQKLSRALAAGDQNVFTLQQRTLDGVTVYALSLDAPGSETFYFNTQSYILEGADWIQAGRSWQARLAPASYQIVPLSAIPAHTFTLNAPTTARVIAQAPPEGTSKGSDNGAGPADDIASTAAAACNTTYQAFTAALQAGDKSMLAICRETNPGMTADRLVAALVAPIKSELDAQVASGAMTSQQEADNLSNLQIKLTHMVADQPGTSPSPKQP